MFNRKRTRELENFALGLARDVASRCPPGKTHEGEHISMNLARAIDDVCKRATEYQRESRLGFYGKAKFGTAFKLELKQAGYPEDLVDTLTRQLLLKMSSG